jgi:hypothetical protein
MRKTAIAFLLIIFALQPAFGQEAEIIKNETDEFSQKRIVQTNFVDVRVEEQGSERLIYSTISVAYVEGDWALVLNTSSESWALLGQDNAYFIAGEQNLEAELNRSDSEVQDDGRVTERNVVFMTTEMRKAFARSETVRMKAGRYVFDISRAVDNEIQTIQAEL